MNAQDMWGNPLPQDVGAGQGFNPTEGRNSGPPPQSTPGYNPTPQAAPMPHPQQRQQQQHRHQQQQSELIANVVEDRLPPMPTFPMLVNTVDAVARRVPWYVWVALGAFGYRWVSKKWSL